MDGKNMEVRLREWNIFPIHLRAQRALETCNVSRRSAIILNNKI